MDAHNETGYLTDREREFARQEEEAQAADLLKELEFFRTQGLGLATMALHMWQGLEGCGLSREERLQLINSALRGR
jgi:hypothetical protein